MSLITNTTQVSDINSRDTVMADLGAYYTALTPTPGTGIIGHAAPTTFDQTKAYVLVYNSGTANIYPMYLRLHTTVVSAGDSTGPIFWTQVLDTGNRFSSGGTSLTPNNTNFGSSNKSGAIITVGAVVCSANTAASRTIAHKTFRPGTVDVVHDQFIFLWGAPTMGTPQLLPTTTASTYAESFAPVVIPPGASFLIHEWAASQSTGPTLEVEFGYAEK